MKRTTVFIDEQLENDLRLLARREGRPTATVVREALARYVTAEKRKMTHRLCFVAIGSSGKHDTAERHEDILAAELTPHESAPAEHCPPRRRNRTA